ncbi:unnamed protein product [Didymodactylos carnosus]|nr:unnamed protein product [Didymodactylos carnosus]CAF4438615.1 unnamed protein product [Didymodactylos carnosus]
MSCTFAQMPQDPLSADEAGQRTGVLGINSKICKFGEDCARKDCTFTHDKPRKIDLTTHSSDIDDVPANN